MPGSLDRKVAVVTGAAQGIGRAIAERLAADGATVVVSDVDLDAARTCAGSIPGADAIRCDVRDEEEVASLVETIVERHGGIDVAVANAGIALVRPLVETSLEDWRVLMSVNLDGVFLTVKHAAPALAARGGGTIVNVASITAMRAAPLLGSYAAAKSAVVSITKTAALELRDRGIRVNAVCPGFADTEMVRSRQEDFGRALGIDLVAEIERKQGRMGTAEDVAGLVAFLASERSSFCTGAAYVVDGGGLGSLL